MPDIFSWGIKYPKDKFAKFCNNRRLIGMQILSSSSPSSSSFTAFWPHDSFWWCSLRPDPADQDRVDEHAGYVRAAGAEVRFYLRRYDERPRDYQSCCCNIFLTISFFGEKIKVNKALILTFLAQWCQYLKLSLLSVAEFGVYPKAHQSHSV